MKLRPLPERRLGTCIVVLAIVASGCAQIGDAEVGMQNLTADVVFGVKKPPTPSGPANFPSPDATQDDTPPPDLTATKSRKSLPPPPPPSASCPAATVNDAPRSVSNTRITTERPGVGQYRWKRAGKYTRSGSSFGLSLAGFEPRQIRDFTDASPDPTNGYVDYRFKTSQPDLIAPNVTIVTSWRVRHLASDDPPITTVRGQQVASTSGGVFLTGTERHEKTATGDEVTRFTPGGSGVVYIPVPFNIGVTFDSVGVDPTTLDTLQNKGSVTKKVQVDACGDLIDAYRVEATQTFTSGQKTSTQTYNYAIATSMGGVLVMEEIDGTLADGSKLQVLNNIGQVDPSPAGTA